MDRSKVIVDHLTKEQIDRSNLSKYQQFKLDKEYTTSAYKNYLAHQLYYTVSMLTRTIYQSVLYEYAGEIPDEKWNMIDLLDAVISDSENRFETGQESISEESQSDDSDSDSGSGSGRDSSSSDRWDRIESETKEGGPKDPGLKFPGIDIKIDLPPTIFTPYDHTKNDLVQEARTNADKAREEANIQHEQSKQAQEAKQAAIDAANAAKEDVERKSEALDKLVEKTEEDTTLQIRIGSRDDPISNPISVDGKLRDITGALIDIFAADDYKGNKEMAKETAEAQKAAVEQFKEDIKNGVPRDEALERAQETLEAGVRDYAETITVDVADIDHITGRTVEREQTIEETIKALEDYAEAKEKEAEAIKEQSEALTRAGIESAKEEMAEERAQEAERAAEQAEQAAAEQTIQEDLTTTTTTTNPGAIEDEPAICSSDSIPCADCGTDSPPCGSDCNSDSCDDCADCGCDDCPADYSECGNCDCDDCAALGAD